MRRSFGFCQVAMSGTLAFGALFALGAGASAQPETPYSPLIWSARESPHQHPLAHDEGVDIVHWYDPVLDRHWVYVAASITEMDGDTVKGTRMAVFKYNAAFEGPGELEPEESAYFPPLDVPISVGDTYKAAAMALDQNTGDIYITGQAPRPDLGASDQDYAIIRYNKNLGAPQGTPLWVTYFNGPVNGDDIPADIGLDQGVGGAAFVVVVTGTSPGDGTGKDIVTVALDTVDGSLMADAWPENVWGPDGVRRYDFNGGDDRAVELDGIIYTHDSQDPSIRVTVLGTSWNGADDDYVTHQWRDSPLGQVWTKGNRFWVTRYDDGGSEDVATGLRVNGNNVSVTGYSEKISSGFAGPTGPNYDFVTESYEELTGNVRWSDRWDYTGAADYPLDIHADAFHMWVVGGGTSGSETHAITLRYVDQAGIINPPDWSDAWSYGTNTFHYATAIKVFGPQSELYLTGAMGTSTADVMLGLKYENTQDPPPDPPYEFDWYAAYGGGAPVNEGRAIVVVPAFPGEVGTNVFITGTSPRSGQGQDVLTQRLRE